MPEQTISIGDLIEEGRRLHRAGQLPRAEAIYRQALEREPANADAMHLLGVAASQDGRAAEAIELIGKAIALRPGDAKFHLNLGLALRRSGKLAEAVKAYRKAIELQASMPEAHLNLGIVLKLIGDLAGAETALRRSVELEPKLAEGWHHLGETLHFQGRHEDSLAPSRRAIDLKPHLVEAHINLAHAQAALHRYREALTSCELVLGIKPDDADTLVLSSVALRNVGEFGDAEECARKAIGLRETDPRAHLALGHSLLEQLRFTDAGESYRRALELNPQMAEAHSARGLVLLLQGNLTEGLAEQGWLWNVAEFAKEYGRGFPQPLWDGGELNGKTILIHSDGGHGDTIHFIRYAPLLKARGARVITECQPALAGLLRGADGVDAVVVRDEALPKFDTHAPMMSLPRLCQTTLETIPNQVPYLHAPVEAKFKLPGGKRGSLKVGLVWAGGAQHRRDWERSIPAQQFIPLVRAPGVDAYSLQFGERAGDISVLKAGGAITDLAPLLGDFTTTAAAYTQLDLIITVDTAAAHLAGALGRPVWLLTPAFPDWRWMLERADSPWYPTMRLYRQAERGSWETVVNAVRDDLERMVQARA